MGGWRHNLRLGEDGLHHYRFVFRGQVYEGNTGCPLWKDARDWLAAYRGRLSKGEQGIASAPTVKQGYLHWIETKTGKVGQAQLDRMEDAMAHVLPFIGQKPADQVTSQDIEALVSHYLEKPSKGLGSKGKGGPKKRTAAGANTLLLYLRALFNHLVRCKTLVEVPWKMEPLRTKKVLRPYVPVEQEAKFFEAVYRTHNLDQALAVRAMFWLGLRESEGIGLRWEWFSWNLRTYTPGLTKGGEAEGLPTEQGLRALLWARIWERFGGVKPIAGLVLDEHAQGFTRKAIYRGGKAVGAKATPHTMRRSFSTNLARDGASAHLIQKAGRWKNLETSERYVQLAKADVEAALEGLQKRRG